MAYDRLYQKLGTKECEKEVFKLARARERKIRDFGVMRCIKDENGKVSVSYTHLTLPTKRIV